METKQSDTVILQLKEAPSPRCIQVPLPFYYESKEYGFITRGRVVKDQSGNLTYTSIIKSCFPGSRYMLFSDHIPFTNDQLTSAIKPSEKSAFIEFLNDANAGALARIQELKSEQ